MQKQNKAETQIFSHYWGAWKMSPWVYFLSWWLTTVQWWRKGSHQAVTQRSGLRFQASQASRVQRPRTAFLTAPAQCFSGGYTLSARPQPHGFGHPTDAAWRAPSSSPKGGFCQREREGTAQAPGLVDFKGVRSKGCDLLSKQNSYHREGTIIVVDFLVLFNTYWKSGQLCSYLILDPLTGS